MHWLPEEYWVIVKISTLNFKVLYGCGLCYLRNLLILCEQDLLQLSFQKNVIELSASKSESYMWRQSFFNDCSMNLELAPKREKDGPELLHLPGKMQNPHLWPRYSLVTLDLKLGGVQNKLNPFITDWREERLYLCAYSITVGSARCCIYDSHIKTYIARWGWKRITKCFVGAYEKM